MPGGLDGRQDPVSRFSLLPSPNDPTDRAAGGRAIIGARRLRDNGRIGFRRAVLVPADFAEAVLPSGREVACPSFLSRSTSRGVRVARSVKGIATGNAPGFTLRTSSSIAITTLLNITVHGSVQQRTNQHSASASRHISGDRDGHQTATARQLDDCCNQVERRGWEVADMRHYESEYARRGSPRGSTVQARGVRNEDERYVRPKPILLIEWNRTN